MPARTSKIFTAGASATALFSMVAAMGWQSGTSAANSSDSTAPAEDLVPTVAEVVPVAPTTTTTSTTHVSLMPSVDDDAPVVVVPKAIAATTLPVQKTTKHKSHTTTKTSG